jgi:hypothetical protein
MEGRMEIRYFKSGNCLLKLADKVNGFVMNSVVPTWVPDNRLPGQVYGWRSDGDIEEIDAAEAAVIATRLGGSL